MLVIKQLTLTFDMKKILPYSGYLILLCSTEEKKNYRFGTP